MNRQDNPEGVLVIGFIVVSCLAVGWIGLCTWALVSIVKWVTSQ